MSVPVKFRAIGDFQEYYSGVRKAPFLTLFIGGNHEASNYLQELYYGGWVAPNIYYLGAANVVRLGPLRIAGLSGIWKGYDYQKSHFERLPYNRDDVKSIYHVREVDIRKLLQIRTQVDIGLSHDWPRAIEWTGDHRTLFRQKDQFEAESRAGTLGNPVARDVLDRLRPAYWFSAHLHVKFSAEVNHKTSQEDRDEGSRMETEPTTTNVPSETAPITNTAEIELDLDMDGDEGDTVTAAPVQAVNRDEIQLDDSDEGTPKEKVEKDTAFRESETLDDLRSQLPAAFARPATSAATPSASKHRVPHPPGITNQRTRFLALDKCVPTRKFLQLLEISPLSTPLEENMAQDEKGYYRLQYDKEWLAITRVFAKELKIGDRNAFTAVNVGEEQYRSLIEKEEGWVDEHIISSGKLDIPLKFEPTAPVDQGKADVWNPPPAKEYTNPQTADFCKMLDIENVFHATDDDRAARMAHGPAPQEARFGGGGRGRGGRGGFDRGRGRGGRGRGRRWH
ncbi:MAG: hypothetical protein M1817_005537 [Caeruleum heppii]|nr:MAG: hypothetical protein M1817_005537 [Caeruleum heppii]